MTAHLPITIGDNVIAEFIKFCEQEGFRDYFLVADGNTFQALGKKVLKAIEEQEWNVQLLIFDPEHLHADDLSLTRVFAVYDAKPRLFVAVGSGTITDITRFTSHRSRNSFVSFPIAASVDAYTSKNAPVTVSGLKGSIYCHAPIAIFADLDTICKSPRFLTASGFADSISKYTSTSDWKYTHLIWNSEFDEGIYRRALSAARQTSDAVEKIQLAEADGMAVIMDSLFESGFCMADFIDSSPASGGEHHIAHLWEMMFHWQGREGLYHGNAVGVALIIEAQWYERLRELSREDARRLLDKAEVPEREIQEAQLHEQVPLIAEEILAKNPIYIQLSDQKLLSRIKKRILDHWDEIQAIAAEVPGSSQIVDWLKAMNAPTTPAELGLSDQQVEIAVENGLYLRERFSMNIIRKLLGW